MIREHGEWGSHYSTRIKKISPVASTVVTWCLGINSKFLAMAFKTLHNLPANTADILFFLRISEPSNSVLFIYFSIYFYQKF